MGNKRGQVFSGELLLAYVIFTLVLIMVVYLWGNTIKGIFESEDMYDLETTAADVSENLMRTPGVPETWNKTTVQTVGLVNKSRILNEDKVLDFIDLMDPTLNDNSCEGGVSNYVCNKHLTGIGVYDFYFSMEYLNGSVISIKGQACTTGKQPENETKKVTMTRTGLLNTTIVQTKVMVWR